ncbi:MAG: hypothetical protein EP329_01405 [Deltaproteobacteria bacterium]|nr:MAG: hypothetical protein EP329_01405 [Deltaproteobacteria bacterium]
MRRNIRSSALVLALTSLVAAGCPDNDVPPTQEDALIVEEVDAVVEADLTYPDEEVSVILDALVRYEPADGSLYGGDYPIELKLLRLVDPATGDAVVLGTGTLQSGDSSTGIGAGLSTRVYYYREGTAKTSELAALCDADAVQVEITVAMPSCDCDAAVLTAPATLTCAEDRRATAQMALTDAGTPAGMPCTRASSVSSFEDHYGYDADGKLIFRDEYDEDGHQSRYVYYWDGERPTAVEVINATNGELASTLTFTWDEAGRLTRADSRSASPPYDTSASVYTYEDGDDLGWTRANAEGTETQEGWWDAAADQLVVRDTDPTDTSASEIRATFSGEYVREAWLAYPEPLAMKSGKPVLFSATQIGGTGLWDRALVWDGDEITSDVMTLVSGGQTGTITTTWDYCH